MRSGTPASSQEKRDESSGRLRQRLPLRYVMVIPRLKSAYLNPNVCGRKKSQSAWTQAYLSGSILRFKLGGLPVGPTPSDLRSANYGRRNSSTRPKARL